MEIEIKQYHKMIGIVIICLEFCKHKITFTIVAILEAKWLPLAQILVSPSVQIPFCQRFKSQNKMV